MEYTDEELKARISVGLTEDKNPDQIASVLQKSEELGIAPGAVEQLDNTLLTQPFEPKGHRAGTLRLLGSDPYVAGLLRNDAGKLDELDAALPSAKTAPHIPAEGIRGAIGAYLAKDRGRVLHSIRTKGYTAKQLSDLALRGYERLKDGTFLYDGKAVKEPVLQEWITGETEALVRERAEQWFTGRHKRAVAAAQEASRDEGFGAGSDMSWLADTRLTPSQRHRKADAAIAYLERRIALMNTLHAIQPGWNAKGTKEIGEYVKLAGEKLGVDFSDISAGELLKGGIEAVDYMQLLNVFGAVDIARAIGKKSPEELRAIGKDAPLEQKVEKITALAALADEARGRTVGAKIVQGVVSSIPFVAEIMGTGGLATVASAGGRIGLRPALTSLLRNAGIGGLKTGLRALAKKETYTELIPQAVRMIGEAEARRLPAYLPKGAASARIEGAGEPFYYYGSDGMRMEIPAGEFDTYAEAFSRAMLNQYIENVTEQAGFFFPDSVITRLLPKEAKRKIFRSALASMERDAVKYSAFLKGLREINPVDGVLGEYLEEKAGDLIRYGATRLAEFTGLNALNFGQDTLLNSPEDEAVTAGVVLLQGALLRGVRAPAELTHYRDVARWIDTHRAVVERGSGIRAAGTNPGILTNFIDETTGGATLFVSAEDAQSFRQSAPEFADAIGLTEQSIAALGKDGRLIPVSDAKLKVAQMRNPQFRELGETFLQKAVLPGISGKKMEDILGREITEEALEDYQKHLTQSRHELEAKIAAVFAPAREAAIPGAEAAEKLFYRMAQYLSANSAADIDVILDEFSIRVENAAKDARKTPENRTEAPAEQKETITVPPISEEFAEEIEEAEEADLPDEADPSDETDEELDAAVSTLREEVKNKDMLNVEKETMRDVFRVSLEAERAIHAMGYATIDDYADALFRSSGHVPEPAKPAGRKAQADEDAPESAEDALDRIFALAKMIRDNPGSPVRFGGYAGALSDTGFRIGPDAALFEERAQEEARKATLAKVREGLAGEELKAFAKQALEDAMARVRAEMGEAGGESVELPESERDAVTASRRLAAALYSMAKGTAYKQSAANSTPAEMVDVPLLDVDIRDAAGIRKMLLARYLGKEVEIKSDGRIALFTGGGLRSATKVRGDHRRAFMALDKALENAYPVGYEQNDGLPKHAGVRGQFVYAALLNISNGENRQPYVATIKLDEPLLETEPRAYFKNITIEKADSLYVKPELQADSPESVRQTERPVRETVRHSTSPGTVRVVESSQRIPDAWAQTASTDHAFTVQEIVAFVKRKFENNPRFSETYYQKRLGDRGEITFAADFDRSYKAVVTLIRGAADGSTLPHECAHWLYKMVETLVQNGQANARMADDFRALNKWLDKQNYKNKDDYAERMEFLARGFEAYLREGRAPDVSLTGAFRTIKRLLLNIYRSVAALNVRLNDDVRRVFDGILSVENAVENEAGAIREIQESLDILTDGLSAADKKSIGYIAREARERAKELALAEREKRLSSLRRMWTADANSELLSIPVYRAWAAIRQAGGLDGAEVESLAGAGIAAELKKRGLLSGKRGAAPAADYAAAEEFATAEELLRSLAESPNPKEYVASYLREREKEAENGEELSMIGVTAEANMAMLDKVVEELSVRAGREEARLSRQRLKAAANEELAGWKMRDLLNESLSATLAKQARELLHFLAKKTPDYDRAFRVALNLRKNIELAKGSVRLRREARAATAAMKRMSRVRKGKMEETYRGALLDLLNRIGITAREAGQHNGKAAALIAAQNAQEDGSVEWEPFLGETAETVPEMTVENFQRVAEFARWLYGVGRDLVAEEKRTFRKEVADHVAECVERMTAGGARYTDPRNKNMKERVLSGGRKFRFWTAKLWNLARRADGYSNTGAKGKTGPVERIVAGMSKAVSEYMRLKQSVEESVSAALKKLAKTERDLSGLPAFTGDAAAFGYTAWTQEMLIAAALNLGNETNRQRLRDGYGWTEEDLNAIAGKLTGEDWREIQKIWDALGRSELTRRTCETFRQENHFSLKLVEAAPFEADGGEIAGGYYPLSYLYRTGRLAEEYIPKTTPEILHGKVSSVQERTDSAVTVGPVRLELSVLTEHIERTAYYAACRMPMRHALGVIRDPAFERAFRSTQSTEAWQAFHELARYAANPHEEHLGLVRKIEAWGRAVNTSTALMGSISTVMMQLGSMSVGIEELGGFYGSALARYLANPWFRSNAVREKSAFLRDRANYMDIDLREGVRAFRQSAAGKAVFELRKLGYWGMRFLDTQVATILWDAAYNKHRMAENADEASAIAYADDFVARTQGGARTVDMSPFQLNTFGRFLAPFISATNAAYNVAVYNAEAMRRGKHAAPMAALAESVLLPWAIPVLIRFALAGGGGDDGEDVLDRRLRAAIREAISSPFGGIPLVRDLADAYAGVISAKATGKQAGFWGSLGEGSFGGLSDAVADSSAAFSSAWDGDPKKALYKAARAAGAVFRLPAVQIYDRARRIAEGYGVETLPDLSGNERRKKK